MRTRVNHTPLPHLTLNPTTTTDTNGFSPAKIRFIANVVDSLANPPKAMYASTGRG